MEPSLGELAPYLIAIAALSLLVVHAMVRFSRTLLSPPPSAAGSTARRPLSPRGLSPRARWGWIYAAAWVALILAFLALFAVLGDGRGEHNLRMLLLVTASWFTAHAVLLAFARAIIRANQRDAAVRGAARERRGAWEEPSAGSRKGAPGGGPEPAVVGPPAGDGAAASSRARREGGARRLGRTLLTLLVVFAAIAIGEAVPPLQRLEAHLLAHRQAFLLPIAVLAGLGFVLLMGGAIHLALAGRSMSRRETEEHAGRVRLRSGEPALFRRTAYRTAGTAAGAAGEDSATFAEVKEAWRRRAWRTSVRWRRLFVMAAGAALMTVGMFGMVIVLAPAGIKLVFGLALIYAATRTAWGFARA